MDTDQNSLEIIFLIAICRPVSNNFLSMFIDSINIFDCSLPGVCTLCTQYIQTLYVSALLNFLHSSFACVYIICHFFQNNFLTVSFRNTIRVSNSLDPDQVRQNAGPVLGPTCLQRFSISADNNGRQRVKSID